MAYGSVVAHVWSLQSQESNVEGSLMSTSLGGPFDLSFCNFPLLATIDAAPHNVYICS